MNTAIENQTNVTDKTTQRPDFGNGRYSAVMEEVWHDSQTIFKLTSTQAEKLARQVATELGVVMASSPVKVKLSKVNDDGKLTIAEACKVKGVTLTNALFCLKALHFTAEAGKNGFSFGHTQWKPTKELAEAILQVTE